MSDLERIESVKAGILGAIAFTLSHLIGTMILTQSVEFRDNGLILSIKVIIFLITGGLFGITYRYIIRGEDNSHLRDGAVLAFGLVRGLVFLEMNPDKIAQWEALTLIIGENILYFLLTRLMLDFALRRGWLEQ